MLCLDKLRNKLYLKGHLEGLPPTMGIKLGKVVTTQYKLHPEALVSETAIT